MKPFIIPIILWGYVLSVVMAKTFWGGVYNRFIVALDLSPSQSWVLPVSLNLIAAVVGLPQVISFITALRRRDTIPASRHVGSSLCIAAACLCVVGAVLGVFRLRQQLGMAAGEWMRSEESDIFAAGRVVNGFYSNRVVGVMMQLPEGWQEMSLNSMRRAKRSGAYAASEGDTQRAEELAAKRRGVYSLFAVVRYPESFPGYNPSLVLSAYDKQAFAAMGLHTLQQYAGSFIGMPDPYHVRSGPLRQPFGTVDGYYVHIEGRFPGATIQQHVYAAETDEVYLVLTASIMDERDLAVMQQAISTLQVTKTPTRK